MRRASFAARVLATVLDAFVVQVVASLAATPLLMGQVEVLDTITSQLSRPRPDMDAVLAALQGVPASVQLAIIAIQFATWFAYGGLLLSWRGATLGQLAAGLRVVPAGSTQASPQRLGANRAWGRSFAWALLWTVGQVGLLAVVLVWSCLRCAWDAEGRTLIDSLLGTRVVRVR